jgi:hypothetical protein
VTLAIPLEDRRTGPRPIGGANRCDQPQSQGDRYQESQDLDRSMTGRANHDLQHARYDREGEPGQSLLQIPRCFIGPGDKAPADQ